MVYFPFDLDRTFWEVLDVDHGKSPAKRRALGIRPATAPHGERAWTSDVSFGVKGNL